MKKLTILTIGFFFAVLSFGQSLSLDVVATAGDYFVGENGSLSWTLGEPIIETFASDDLILTQGFQQSYYSVVAVQDLETDTYDVKIFPIPARDFINIEITSQIDPANLNLELYDVMGNVVFQKYIENTTFFEKIYLTGYQTNMFFLKVSNTTNQQVKTFKILKVRF